MKKALKTVALLVLQCFFFCQRGKIVNDIMNKLNTYVVQLSFQEILQGVFFQLRVFLKTLHFLYPFINNFTHSVTPPDCHILANVFCWNRIFITGIADEAVFFNSS